MNYHYKVQLGKNNKATIYEPLEIKQDSHPIKPNANDIKSLVENVETHHDAVSTVPDLEAIKTPTAGVLELSENAIGSQQAADTEALKSDIRQSFLWLGIYWP